MSFGTAVAPTPVSGDYDGDGKTDVGLFYPNGQWWWRGSQTGAWASVSFGTSGSPAPVK